MKPRLTPLVFAIFQRMAKVQVDCLIRRIKMRIRAGR